MHELGDAKQTVHVQAYFFYIKSDRESIDRRGRARREGRGILRASNQTKRYSAADFLAHEGIETYIDSQHGIARNKIIIIDGGDGFNRLVQLHQSRRGK